MPQYMDRHAETSDGYGSEPSRSQQRRLAAQDDPAKRRPPAKKDPDMCKLIRVHGRSACEGRGIPCCIHAPSSHHMLTWRMNWREDTGVMERICPHGIGHPDPDHMAYVRSLKRGLEWQGVHGCDGCCKP